jgi:hypothetical protein
MDPRTRIKVQLFYRGKYQIIIFFMTMDRVGFRSGHIILLLFLTRSESDPIKFGSQNFDPYPTRRVTSRPDPTGHETTRSEPYKIIKYLLIIFIYF